MSINWLGADKFQLNQNAQIAKNKAAQEKAAAIRAAAIAEYKRTGKAGGEVRVGYFPSNTPQPGTPAPAPQVSSGGGGGAASSGGGYAGYSSNRSYYAPSAAQIAEAQKQARISTLKSRGSVTLDELVRLYDEIIGKAKTAYGDQTNRINGNYDTKVHDQGIAMNDGMYDVDQSAAAGNLADSSYRSTDRGKVRTATEKNIKILNESRANDIAEIGKLANSDIADFTSKKDSTGYTRQLLNETTSEDDLTSTNNALNSAKTTAIATKAKYDPQGDFVTAANKLGNYDTTTLEKTLQGVIDNASATSSTKIATVNDIINGTGLDEAQKAKLKTKYNQIVG